MGAPDIWVAVRRAGVTLTAEGTGIRATPKTALTDELRTAIRANREAILAVLRGASEAEREAHEERAAILEFCAGYSRAEAERVAGLIQ